MPALKEHPPSDNWSDAQKFRAETWRTVIFGVLGAGIATIILGTYSDANKSGRDIRVKAIDEFIRNSHHYAFVQYGYCERQDTSERSFDWGRYEDYRTSRRALFIYFGDKNIYDLLNKTVTIDDQLRDVCRSNTSSRDTWEQLLKDLQGANNEIARLADRRVSQWWRPF